MDNSYTSSLDGNKSGGQIFTCDICFKEFLYHQDFAYHMRFHMEPMQQLQQPLPQRAYPGPPGSYNVPVSSVPVSSHLEGFDKLLPPYTSEPVHSPHVHSPHVHSPQVHSPHEQRGTPQPGPVSETDKLQYRPELDRESGQMARHVDVRGHPGPVTMDMRGQITDTKMTAESRTLPADSHNVQNVTGDGRLQPSVESYMSEQNKSQLGGTHVSYSSQRSLMNDDYMDSRKHMLSKVVDSQSFTKPNPYYLQPPPHYGLSKVLDPSQGLYYPTAHVHSQGQMDYYGHPAAPPSERKVPSFYYGQPPLASPPVSMPEYPPYNIAGSHSTQAPDSRGQLGKVPDQGDLGRPYPTSHLSPPSAHADIYKRGLVGQTQEYNAVPSHMPTVQSDFNLYKNPADMAPSLNTEARAPVSENACHICMLPCANSLELAEHMRSHSRERMLPKPVATSIPMTTPVTQVYSRHMQGNTSISMASTRPSAFYQHHINSQSSTSAAPFTAPTETSAFSSTFPDTNKQSAVTVRPQTEGHKFQCRFCQKDFDKLSRCTRHEALHQRDINLFYCEVCEEPFKYKGNYLYHIQKQHESGGNSQLTEVIVDCQVCDEEVEKTKLVAHLNTHPVKRCDKCDRVFEQKAEYVEHLMNKHRQELTETSESRRDIGESDGVDRSESERELSDEKDSGLEEDHDKDIEEQSNEDAASDKGHSLVNLDEHKRVNKEPVVVDTKARKEKERKKRPVMKNLKDNVIIARQMEERKAEIKTKKSPAADKTGSGVLEAVGSRTELKFSCSKCDRSFAKKDELSLHVETHTKDPTRTYCEICDMSYHVKEKGYYIYHMKYHTVAELDKLQSLPAKLKCQVCSTAVPKEKLVSHMKETHAQFNCDICKWSYSTESSLLVHMKRIHGGNKKCQVVKKTDGEVSVEEKHVPVVYKKLKDIKAEQLSSQAKSLSVFTCKICGKTFDKKANFDRHMKVSHLKADGLYMYCEVCNGPFSSRGTYLYHIQKDHFDSQFKLSQGVSQDESDNKCSETSVKNEVDKSLEQTESSTTLEDNSVKIEKGEKEGISAPKQVKRTVLNPETGNFEEKMVDEIDETCNDLGVKQNKVSTVKDDASSDAVSMQGSPKSSVVVSDIIYCKLCNISLKKQMLFEHMKAHTVFNCDLCEYTFTKKQGYLSHKRLLHLDDFIADEINSVLDLKKSKEAHELKAEGSSVKTSTGESNKRKRTETAKFLTCLLCEVEFKQDKYVEHIKTHLKPKLSCQFCERLFSKKSLLVIHERSHNRISHKKDELPYPKSCPVCDSKMNSRSQYVEHLREHTGKRPIKCKKCGEQFTSESSLDNHVKVKHDIHSRIIWKLDGEGMKFDPRCGRIADVMSDYLSEIKEINEQLLSHGKSEIWIGATPKKAKEKLLNKKVKENEAEKAKAMKKKGKEDEEDEEDEEEDEEPEIRRRSRRSSTLKKNNRKIQKDDEEEDENDDDDEEYDVEEDEGEEDETTQDDDDEDFSPSKKRRRTRSGFGSGDSESEEEKYTPKGTRTRRNEREAASRHSRRTSKSRPVETGTKRKSVVTRTDVVKKLKGSPSLEETEKTPIREKKFKCPVCQQGFTRVWNMTQHAKDKHKNYKEKLDKSKSAESVAAQSPITGKLRTRATNLNSELGQPASSSTPVKKTKELVVQISPLDVSLLNKSADSAAETDTSSKSEKYVCQYCNKSITRKWNYQKHLQYHEKRLNISKDRDSSADSLTQSAAEKSENSDASSEPEQVSKTRSLTQQGRNTPGKQNASNDDVKYECDVCSKVIYNHKWNYMQHMKAHKKDKTKNKETNLKSGLMKKDLKKNGKESKPFPCRDCPEAFKKKRDLYIHAKVHLGGSQEEGNDGSLMDLSGKSDGCTRDSSSASLSQSSDMNTTTELSTSQVNESDVDGKSFEKSGLMEETDENKNEKDHQLNSGQGHLDVDKGTVDGKSKNSDVVIDDVNNDNDLKRKTNEFDQDETNGTLDSSMEDAVTGAGSDRTKRQKGDSLDVSSHLKVNDEGSPHDSVKISKADSASSDRGSESPSLPSSHSSTSSEHEEKGRASKSPHAVVKMSSQSAMSKWKAKVQMTLSSQLELNQTKKQQLQANPEIARVKGYLSISGKPERKNFECRLCGVSVHQEEEFRSHMDVHLHQSPPYCGICDIYFMAIYPMRRLAEHNRKKHPELAQKSTTMLKSSSV